MIPTGNILLEEAVELFIRRCGNLEPVPKATDVDEETWDQCWTEHAQGRQSLKRDFSKPFIEGVLIACVYDSQQKSEFEISRSQWAKIVDTSLWDVSLLSGPIGFGCDALLSEYHGLVPYTDRAEFNKWLSDQLGGHSVLANVSEAIETTRSRPFSQARLKFWYEQRVARWPEGKRPPSRDEDVVAAREELSINIPRDAVRDVRNEYAPLEWMKKGRRG